MSVLCDCICEKGSHLPVVGYIYISERERERKRERERESIMWHQRCELIYTYGFLSMWSYKGFDYIYRRKVSVLCGCIGEKGIHLPVVGYIYFRERERERERESERERERKHHLAL